MTWQWSVYDQYHVFITIPNVDTSKSILVIPKYSLAAGANYSISLSAYYTPSLVGTDDVTVSVGVQDLVAVISGGSYLVQAANTTLVLNASGSYDPDYNGINPGLFLFSFCIACHLSNYCRPDIHMGSAGVAWPIPNHQCQCSAYLRTVFTESKCVISSKFPSFINK